MRYYGQEATEKVIDFSTGSLNFGHELADHIQKDFPKDNPAGIVDIYTPMFHVCENLSSYGLTALELPRPTRHAPCDA